jgi:transposase
MQAITTIGFDIAKSVFQVNGVDVAGQVIVRRQLKRGQVIAFFRLAPRPTLGERSHRSLACLRIAVPCDQLWVARAGDVVRGRT